MVFDVDTAYTFERMVPSLDGIRLEKKPNCWTFYGNLMKSSMDDFDFSSVSKES